MSFSATLRRGFRYVASAQLFGYALRFGSNLILTRLLAPDLFGLVAVASAFVYGAAMLSDVGLRSAIIQDPRAEERRHRDVVWSVMTFRVLGFYLLIVLALWGVQWGAAEGFFVPGSVYRDERLPLVLLLLALAESLKFLESVEVLYCERTTQFKTLFRLETGRQLVGTAVTVAWAWADPGVVALCMGSVLSNGLMLVLSYVWIGRRGPRWIWVPQEMRHILLNGRWLLVSAVLTFAMNALDRIYLAKYFDAFELGLYSIAMIFGLVVVDLIAKVGASVIFPVISERVRADDPELWRPFYQARRAVLLVSLASGFFFIAFGDDLIRLLYDDRYEGAGVVLQAFGLVAMLSLYSPSGDAYLAMGHAKVKSIVYAVRLLGLVAGLALYVPHGGPVGGVWALVVSYGCGAVAMLLFNHRLGLFRWREELRALGALGAVGGLAFAIGRW